mmetsp:Transcript_26857/g.65270  ORF Transcript_26857/g.65270 Transcript_26857/m.65270 type:complete len:330 (-) Transcript_26857:214-1203(-)|eukprot:CAMPEP_0113607434 /NCGR_PEP_ID=MMETSP0017_2-20120614/3383_1 /TAXON_ID=2856 /ORGANISM="Cylindrotheca closterium" /LENGTH=329 /DNA_ID=CAMNT_0000516039 /DNA_START=1214 /DNA_END=2203 /DNA_ORIENTATION=- /assembly_acc=CAM_ASM_000147
MSAQDSKQPKDQTEVDLIRQAATDSVTALSNERKHKRQRRRKPFDEAISHNAQRVYDVRSADIIFGRGKGYQDHPGNKRMRAIIRQYKEEYNTIHRSRKRDLVEAVYSEITQGGARFLHKSSEEDVFVVVDIPIALQKVRNTLRCKKSGMVPTDDDEAVASAAAVAEGSVTVPKGTDPKVGAVSSAVGMQGLLPLDFAGLSGHPLASQVGLMSQSSMVQSPQLEPAMLPPMHPATNPLSNGGLLANNLLSQTHFARLGGGLGGMQLPLTQQPVLQHGIPALAGGPLAQGFPLMGSMSLLPGTGPMLGQSNGARSTEPKSSIEPQDDTNS